MKTVIGERVMNAYEIILVAVPKNPDECIRICDFPISCIDGDIYYSDNTMKHLDSYETMMKYLSIEEAKKLICYFDESMSLTVVYLPSALTRGVTKKGYEATKKRMYKKLNGMTARDFNRGGY